MDMIVYRERDSSNRFHFWGGHDSHWGFCSAHLKFLFGHGALLNNVSVVNRRGSVFIVST